MNDPYETLKEYLASTPIDEALWLEGEEDKDVTGTEIYRALNVFPPEVVTQAIRERMCIGYNEGIAVTKKQADGTYKTDSMQVIHLVSAVLSGRPVMPIARELFHGLIISIRQPLVRGEVKELQDGITE